MNIMEILEKHKAWLRSEPWGEYADLSNANLSNANLRYADLSNADLRNANLRNANLRYADLSNANLSNANLSNANLSNANLSNADLSNANLSNANLRNANLRNADLSNADLSNADGLLSAIEFLNEHFERTDEGFIAYKTFGSNYNPPEKWVLQPGSIITENVNFNRCNDCGCGINVAPLKWVEYYHGYEQTAIWKVLIRFEWLAGVCVPYHTDGKIRCEKVQLLEIVKEVE